MVVSFFMEMLFWREIPLLLRKEKEWRESFSGDVSSYESARDAFIREHIPRKSDFLARLDDYAKNGEPIWVAGRNQCCDDLSLMQLKKAFGNEFRGEEKARFVEQGVARSAAHIPFYTEKVLSDAENNILEMTIGAGFGTASVVSKMRENDFYVGIDIDFKCAKNADGILRHYGKSGVAVAATLWNMPFDDETFSVVCSQMGIEECREVPMILKEASRVLRRGGRLVLACSDSGYERVRKYFDMYDIGRNEALDCLRQLRCYADCEQLDKYIKSQYMELTDIREFNGKYAAVYTK